MIAAQLVSLACNINAARKGIEIPDFFPQNSTCNYCARIRFLRPKEPGVFDANTTHIVANDPDEWFEWVRSQGYTRAWLIHQEQNRPMISDRMSAGFVGGGGNWFIATEKNHKADCWQARWEAGERKAPENRIWRVDYMLVCDADVTENEPTDLKKISNRLSDTLNQIHEFALKHGYDYFAGCFGRAIQCLESDDPFSLVHHKDLAPPGLLSLDAIRLLACSQAAWVFGGMGSWNDMGFEGEENEKYENLSDSLFNLINEAICEATNSPAETLSKI